MKICFITSLYPPIAFGGATGVAQMEAEYLTNKGNRVFVITTSPDKSYHIEWINNVKVYRLPPSNIYTFYENFKNQNLHGLPSKILWHIIDTFNFKIANKVREIINKEKPDIIHVHNFKGLSTIFFNKIKAPIVFTAHDYSILCPKANLLRSDDTICKKKLLPCSVYTIINRALLDNKIDVVISPSEFLIGKFKENGLFKKAKLISLPNPIKLNKRRSPPKFYDKLRILYVGELSKSKGLHVLIKAFKKISNATLHIYGKGKDENYFKKMAKNNEDMIFHGYANGFEELKEAYERANVTVVPSIWYEVFGMIIIESFVCSTPVVASRIGGIPELVRDGYNGFLFEPGNVDELADILNEISGNPRILRKLEKGARESSKKYDIKEHINKLEEIYRSLTGKNHKRTK
ncbi:MAG: glycosyltransferase family 4 protein [Thermoplasmatales archaeon]|nr:glycosyltransferase family 4 protein [Thermoplasmatales archaeon]